MPRHLKSRRRRKAKNTRKRQRKRGGATPGSIFVNWGPKIGLGNQLFIYSAAVKVQKETGKEILLFPAENNHHSTTDYRPMFKHGKPVDRTPEMLERMEAATKLHENTFVFYGNWGIEEKAKGPGDVRIKNTATPGYSDGFYQNYESIKDIIPDIRKELVPQLQEKYKELPIKAKAAFMHVRRGDLIGSNEHSRPEYLQAALKYMDNIPGVEVIYVVANPEDSQWSKEQNFQTKKVLEWFIDPDELKAMYLMSQCSAGAIISSSTFGTWGAILGADANPSSTILYPKVWSPNNPKAVIEFPGRWIPI